jgi:hypothetical protein
MRRITWPGAALAALAATAALGSAAQAAQSGWQCGASAVTGSLAGNALVNPVTTSTDPCVSNGTGLDDLPAPLGLPGGALSAATASATTTASPRNVIPAEQGIGAVGRTENLSLGIPGTPLTLGLRTATARAGGICVTRRPVLDGSSEVLGATLGGQELPLEQIAQQLSSAVAPLNQVVDLKADEQIRSATGLTQRALHLRILTAAGTPVLDVVAGEARVGYAGTVCDPTGQSAANASNETLGGARSAASLFANGVRGSATCARLRMHFERNKKTAFASRYGHRTVIRGRIVNCKGKSIVRARIDVIHVIKGKRHLVKTGLRSRSGGNLTLILPSDVRTRDLRFEYRGNLASTKVTSRSVLHLTVRNGRGKVVR